MTAPVVAARMPWPTCHLGVCFIIAPSVSIPAARQNRSKDADTSSHALPTGALGTALVIMVDVFMALLSFRGFGTPSLPAQGEQRRPF
jgi:hypothetical protein